MDSVERRTKTSSNGAAIEQKYVLLFHSEPLQDGTILYVSDNSYLFFLVVITLNIVISITGIVSAGDGNCARFSELRTGIGDILA